MSMSSRLYEAARFVNYYLHQRVATGRAAMRQRASRQNHLARPTAIFSGLEPLEPRIMLDGAPTVLAFRLNEDALQRSMVTSIAVDFSKDVSASLQASDLHLQNLTTGQAVDPAATAVSYDPATNRATWTFPGLAGKTLTNGNYTATLASAGITDSQGNTLDGNGDGIGTGLPADDYRFDFYRYYGDADGDRDVDNLDLFKFRQTFPSVSEAGLTALKLTKTSEHSVRGMLQRLAERSLRKSLGITGASLNGASPLQALTPYNPLFDSDADGDVDNLDLFRFRQTFQTDLVAPMGITTSLNRDTAPAGASDDSPLKSDGITFDPTVTGRVAFHEDAAKVRVGLDVTPLNSFVDITGKLGPNGSFLFGRTDLESILGAPLSDGQHTLHLRAEDTSGGALALADLSFTLDTVAATPTLDLATDSDPNPLGDQETAAAAVNLVGQAEPGAMVLLNLTGATTTADEAGLFEFPGVPLSLGSNTFTATATDIAGNISSFSQTITRHVAILNEDDSFVAQSTLPIDLGQEQGSRTLRLMLEPHFDTTDTAPVIEDVFLVYLVDPNDPSQTLLGHGTPGSAPGTALFSLAGDQADFVPGLVSFDGATVRIDLTSLGALDQGLLVLQMLNSDADTGSRVEVVSLENEVDEEGVASPVFPVSATTDAPGSAIDLSTLTPSSDVEVLVSNVRFNQTTGRYTAELRVWNHGEALGRNVVVLFPGLPPEVTMLNPSGTDIGGNPYINFLEAIRRGGLAFEAISDPIQIEFDNPDQVRFNLTPEVLVGGPNQAPVFEPVGELTVMPGDKLEVPLVATDPDGDLVTFSIQSDDALPTGMLQANGTLTFSPTPDQVGDYAFTLIASDGALQTTQEVTLHVVADAVTTARLSGVILDTDGTPLVAVPIEVGPVQTVTGVDGSFELDFGTEPLPADTLKVHGEDANVPGKIYPFIAEKLPLLLGHEVFPGVNNVIDRPIYLPALDVDSGSPITPDQDNVVHADLDHDDQPDSDAMVLVAANTLVDQQGNPFTGVLSITQVPMNLTPAPLPENLFPDIVVTIQPGEMVFLEPAKLTLPNTAGYAPGTLMDLWSINPVTGFFDNVGTGQVSPDGSMIETITGGIRNSSWHFFASSTTTPEPTEKNKKCEDCDCDPCSKAKVKGDSEVELHSGALIETHDLASYESLGVSRAKTLTYDSMRADPRPIVHVGYRNVPPDSQSRLIAKMTLTRGEFQYQVAGHAGGEFGLTGGEHFWSLDSGGAIEIALQVDTTLLATGRYDYQLDSGVRRFNGSTFIGSASSSTDEVIVVNSIDSIFGAGWGLTGLYEIAENPDGSVLLINGDGGQVLFEAPAPGSNPGDPYIPTPTDFTTLVKLPDGTFQRTTEDQTVYRFNAANKVASMTDRNSNITTYGYDGQNRLIKITDPVGLETVFDYSGPTGGGKRVTSITDPANRVTQLEYDAAGNLVKITDPDGTFRTWEYDAQHRMVGEIDKRGNHEQSLFDFAGRATGAIRRDGSELHFAPAKTRSLLPPEDTIDPLNSPSAFPLDESAESHHTDANGNVTHTVLNRRGAIHSSNDGAGNLPTYNRDNRNLITRITDARGFETTYTYDERGNILTISDPIAFGGANSATLFPNPILPITNGPTHVTSADLNSDDILDVVTGNLDDNSVSVFLVGSDGTFAPRRDYAVGAGPGKVLAADLNDDGFLDLVSPNRNDNTISVLLGLGDGTFSPRVDYPTGDSTAFGPSSVAVSDVNKDGNVDLLVTSADRFAILLGNGDGTFDPFNQIPVNDLITSPVGDLNKDGNLDLVTANYENATGSSVTVILGNSDGTFTPFQDFPVGINPVFVVSADLNHDGNLDLIAGNDNAGDRVSVLLGNGDGTFGSFNTFETGGVQGAIQVADLDHNGDLDLIIPNLISGNSISVLLGDGTGGFGPYRTFDTGSQPVDVAVSDLNDDGSLDLVVGNSTSSENHLSILFGHGDGTFATRADYPAGDTPYDHLAADFNNDGNLDIAVTNRSEAAISVFLGTGEGTFQPRQSFSIGVDPSLSPSIRVAAGDLNKDGKIDLVTANHSKGSASILLGQGDGTFGAPQVISLGANISGVDIADFNKDTNPDIVVSNHDSQQLTVLLGSGDGATFTRHDVSISPHATNVVKAVDLNNDGNLDLVAASDAPRGLVTILGHGDGTFSSIVNLPTLGRPLRDDFYIADFNGDGLLDAAAGEDLIAKGQFVLSIFFGHGDGTFSLKRRYTSSTSITAVSGGDVDGDGQVDLITTPRSGVSVWRGAGDGTFAPPVTFAATGTPAVRAPAVDLNHDDRLDIITVDDPAGTISVLLNQRGDLGGVPTGRGRREFTYDTTFNQMTSMTDELGRQTLYELDPATGNVLKMTRVVGELDTTSGGDDLVTTYTYTSHGLVDTMTNPLGRVTDYDYDALGRLIKETFAKGTPDEAFREYEYDAVGNRTAVIDENGHRTQYEYDALNRLIRITEADPDGDASSGGGGGPLTSPVTEFDYDANGNLVQTTDARGNITINKYDAMDRLIQITAPDPDGDAASGGGPLESPITTSDYDLAGNLVATTDPNGHVTRNEYDSRNRLVKTIDPEGGVTKFRYDADNNRTSVTDPLGHVTKFAYDMRNRVTAETDPLGHVTRYTYDPVNNLIAMTDRLGRRTRSEYDDLDRLVRQIDPLGGVSTSTYDKANQLITQTDQLGRTTHFTYDHRDRLIAITNPLGDVSRSEYDAAGNLVAVTDELGRTTQYTYDALDRQIQLTDPLGNRSISQYDAMGNLVAATDARGNTTHLTYDALNRQIEIINAEGKRAIYSYDALGNLIAVTDELGRQTQFIYDGRNRLTQTIDPDGGITKCTYDHNDNLISLTDPVGNKTTFEYDELNRLFREIDPLGKARSFEYDAVGNLVAMTDRNGRRTEMEYDALDRVVQERWIGTDQVIASSYDPVGNLLQITDRFSSLAVTYDDLNRPTRVDNAGTPGSPHVVLDYRYDPVGNVLAVSDSIDGTAAGVTSYAYDTMDRTTRITQSGSGLTEKRVDLDYNPIGQLGSIQRFADLAGNGLVAESSYHYDTLNRIRNLTHSNTLGTISFFDFEYDDASQITALTDVDGRTDYTYDNRSQLIGADHADATNPDEGYTYDANGNRLDSHLHGNGYVTGPANTLLSDGTFTYDYDDEGNTIRRMNIATGEVREFTYDHRNRLVRVTDRVGEGGVVTQEVEFTYDALNRRIAKMVDADGAGAALPRATHFVYDREDVILDFVDVDDTGPSTPVLAARYLHGPGVDMVLAQENYDGAGNSTSVLWLLTDHLGTTRDLVDSSGGVVNHLTYDSFGKVIAQTEPSGNTRYLYTGREFDPEIDLYHYRARTYDATLGRFAQRDPIGFKGGWNLYEYVHSAPTMFLDPSGLEKITGDVKILDKTMFRGGSWVQFTGPGPVTLVHFHFEADVTCNDQGTVAWEKDKPPHADLVKKNTESDNTGFEHVGRVKCGDNNPDGIFIKWTGSSKERDFPLFETVSKATGGGIAIGSALGAGLGAAGIGIPASLGGPGVTVVGIKAGAIAGGKAGGGLGGLVTGIGTLIYGTVAEAFDYEWSLEFEATWTVCCECSKDNPVWKPKITGPTWKRIDEFKSNDDEVIVTHHP